MKSVFKAIAVAILWTLTTAGGCMREPDDPRESIPTGRFLTSEEYRLKLTLPSSFKVETDELPDNTTWKLFYEGYETAPVMEIEASKWRSIPGTG